MDESAASIVEVRDLTGDDRGALKAFRCASYGQPWTRNTEESIRDVLGDLVASGDVNALGLFDGDVLCAVEAWTIKSGRWTSAILATANGHKRQGHAKRLKHELLARAQDAGALSVTSTVHIKNEVMIDMNVKMGASVVRDRAQPDYMLCTIRLR